MITRIFPKTTIMLAVTLLSCSSEQIDSNSSQSRFIDSATPQEVMPVNSHIGTDWKLSFSDEFNDSRIDFNKWTINNDTKTRTPRPALGIKEWFHKPENVSEIQNEDGGMLVLGTKKTETDVMYCSSVNTLNSATL